MWRAPLAGESVFANLYPFYYPLRVGVDDTGVTVEYRFRSGVRQEKVAWPDLIPTPIQPVSMWWAPFVNLQAKDAGSGRGYYMLDLGQARAILEYPQGHLLDRTREFIRKRLA
jgi:hypothetical protein